MSDMREAGLVLGAAIGTLKKRVDEVEAKELTVTVPVPSVENVLPEMSVTVEPAKLEQTIEVKSAEVTIPAFPEFPEIDLTAIVEAISQAAVGDKIEAVGDKVSDAARATSEAQAMANQTMIDLIGAIQGQQAAINSLVSKVDAMGENIVNVLSAPKELVLDSDGDPIGVQTVARQLN